MEIQIMKRIYEEFFRKLLDNSDRLSAYIKELYDGGEYTKADLHRIFGILKENGLITCQYADNKVYNLRITFEGEHYFDGDDEDKDLPPLALMIDELDDIEALFHKAGGDVLPEYEEIHDVHQFQDWLMAVKLELQEIYERIHDTYVWETINVCNKKMNGLSDRGIFSEIAGRLKAMRGKMGKYYKGTRSYYNQETSVEMKEKKPLIFISHSSKNKEQAKLFADMLHTLNLVPKQDIFCSSIPGYDIPLASEYRIFDFLRSRFLDYDIHVIFILSPEYYESPVSLNEMGAAWVLKAKATSILLPGFGFDDMKGVISGDRIAISLDSDKKEIKDKLNQLRHIIVEEFDIIDVSDSMWEDARDRFIEEITPKK